VAQLTAIQEENRHYKAALEKMKEKFGETTEKSYIKWININSFEIIIKIQLNKTHRGYNILIKCLVQM